MAHDRRFDKVLVAATSYDSNVLTDPVSGALFFVWNQQFGPTPAVGWPRSYNAIMAQRMATPGQLDSGSRPVTLLKPGRWVSEFRDGVGSMKIVESVHVHQLCDLPREPAVMTSCVLSTTEFPAARPHDYFRCTMSCHRDF